MWVRGLKPNRCNATAQDYPVAPYVGAWIETNTAPLRYGVAESRTLCGCVD